MNDLYKCIDLYISHRYEDEFFDVTEWGRGHQEEPEEDWRGQRHLEAEEEWRGRGNEHGYEHNYDQGYEHGYDRGYEHRYGRSQGRGYDHGYDHDYDHGYNHEHDPGYNQGYGHREEDEDDRGRSTGYHYTETIDEPRVIADESLFRWLAVSYASTHLTMTHNYHSSCHGDAPTGGHGIVNRAKWKPVTGSKSRPVGSYIKTDIYYSSPPW